MTPDIRIPTGAPTWLKTLVDNIKRAIAGSRALDAFAVADVPPAADNARLMIFVTDESGGAIPAFSDGTDWRRVTDRAIIS
jgi:hypothetical protein